MKPDLGPTASHHKSQTKRGLVMKMRENYMNKNMYFLLLFMSVIRIQLIVITYHTCSREQIPQEPKSMISLNHQAPAVNQDTLVQHCCSPQWAAIPRLYWGVDQSLCMVSERLVSLFGSHSDSAPWTPPQNMPLIAIGLSESNFPFSVVVRTILI